MLPNVSSSKNKYKNSL